MTDLEARVEEFERSVRGLEAGRDGEAAARTATEVAFASALAAVRKLDVLVVNQLSKQERLCRIEGYCIALLPANIISATCETADVA